MKKLVSERALLARINRALVDEVVKKCRPDSRSWYDLGDYYSVDLATSMVIDKDIDIEAYGRELGCLAEHEALDAREMAKDMVQGVIDRVNKLQAEYDAMSKEQKAALTKETREFFEGS